MDTIGLIGVGLLGSAIAARLKAAGYGVLGYDLLPERRIGAGSAQEVRGQVPHGVAVPADFRCGGRGAGGAAS